MCTLCTKRALDVNNFFAQAGLDRDIGPLTRLILSSHMATHTPNFFIVGAAKAGTTSFARYLAEHPQVYMSPIKEPSYFARDIIPSLRPPNWKRNQKGLDRYLNGPMSSRRGGCVLDWESYLKLFRNVATESAIGEASTAYLISPKAPSDIRSTIPEARIIILLRSPIDRVFSTYLMFCRKGRLRASFSEVIRSTANTGLSEWRGKLLQTRKIADGVERFLNAFPEGQIRWYFHEELSADPLVLMQKTYAFLGVDSKFQPDFSRRYNVELVPKSPVFQHAAYSTGLWDFASRITPRKVRPTLRRLLFQTRANPSLCAEDRAILVDYFKEDVDHLSRLVDRDLSHWMKLD